MLKTHAIATLGGSVASVAEAVGVSYQAVDKWPDVLPARIADRVIAAIARRHLPPELIGIEVECGAAHAGVIGAPPAELEPAGATSVTGG